MISANKRIATNFLIPEKKQTTDLIPKSPIQALSAFLPCQNQSYGGLCLVTSIYVKTETISRLSFKLFPQTVL